MSPFDETRARRYLLGQLSEEEMAALETEYFASVEALESVSEVEHDLVDAFVAGELASGERSAFESHYLASEVHRERVATARLLRAATRHGAAPTRGPAWSVWLPLAAALVLLLAPLWLRERPGERAVPVAEAGATPAPAATPTPSGEPSREPGPSLPPRRTTVAALALSPMLLRGGQPTPVLRVPPGTDELAITLRGDRPEGIAAGTRLPFDVSTVEGTRVAAGHVRLAADGLGVARIAAASVPAGDYILSVGAADAPDGPLRRYFFRVAR
ncbi:MAG TPA: hypothetical protein VFQ51_05290 [Vicinamibacteria bacterium]|nr:hypothetical protein [Vicinamibacteria bacterium]